MLLLLQNVYILVSVKFFYFTVFFDIQSFLLTPCFFAVCKSCVVKHLEEENTCPTCELVIHQSHPLNYINFDRTMQDMVYKLVPGLEESMVIILSRMTWSNIT